MISQIIRVSSARIVIAATWEALQEDKWTDAQLAELLSRWEAADFLISLRTIAAMERATGVDALEKMRGAKISDFENFGIATSPDAPDDSADKVEFSDKAKYQFNRLLLPYRIWRWKASWSYDEELFYLRMAEHTVDASQNIAATRTFLPAVKDLQPQVEIISDEFDKRALPLVILGPVTIGTSVSIYFERVAAAETGRRLLIAALALKRFHLQHGAYPASLNELVPQFLKQVPMDPWDGKPLRYKLKPDGTFLLYSIGEDGVDNGGEALSPGTLNDWMRGRDIVWPRAATPAEVENFQRSQTNGVSTNKVVK